MTTEMQVADAAAEMPRKTREVDNHHMDSTIWNEIKLRPDDIIIATHSKSGTTWTQQIVAQLIHQGDPTIPAAAVSPWVDLRIVPRPVMLSMIEGQEHRRFMKTHLPLDAVVWDPKVKYIFIGRDGRDMIWSLHNHLYHATPTFYGFFNDNPAYTGPQLSRPAEDPREMFVSLVDNDMHATGCWPFWSHVRTWWAARNQPNMLFLHFNDLKADLEGEMKRIAKFLETPEMPEDKWKAAVEHCSFDWMKQHAGLFAPPQAETAWDTGADRFIHKGTNGRWKDVLSDADNQKYEHVAKKELGDECAHWLNHGGHV